MRPTGLGLEFSVASEHREERRATLLLDQHGKQTQITEHYERFEGSSIALARYPIYVSYLTLTLSSNVPSKTKSDEIVVLGMPIL